MVAKERIAFLVGMPRAATTFLYHNFSTHPHVFIPYRRKTNFFSLHYGRGENFFLSHFREMPEESVAIDTETLAFFDPALESPQRIHQFNQRAKVILCLRDPGDWAVSLYRQVATFDKNLPPFEHFLAGKYRLIEDGKEIPFAMRPGDIAARIEEYRRLFPESLLILRFNDLISDPVQSLRRIEGFLGISAFYTPENVIISKINSSDRPHNRILNLFLRNDRLIGLIKVMLPRRFVLFLRLAFDRLSAKFSPDTVTENLDLREISARYYEKDRLAMERHLV